MNKDSILKQGLLKSKGQIKAICTVRSDDTDIWHHIAISQLSDGGKYMEFNVIKLSPLKHNIDACDVAPDTVNEETAPLHNYIVKDIKIDEADIIDTICTYEKYVKIDKSKIVHLKEYKRKGLPKIDKELKSILENF